MENGWIHSRVGFLLLPSYIRRSKLIVISANLRTSVFIVTPKLTLKLLCCTAQKITGVGLRDLRDADLEKIGVK